MLDQAVFLFPVDIHPGCSSPYQRVRGYKEGAAADFAPLDSSFPITSSTASERLRIVTLDPVNGMFSYDRLHQQLSELILFRY